MFDQIFRFAKLIAVLCSIPVTIFLCIFLQSLTGAANAVATLPAKVDVQLTNLQTNVMAKIDTVQDKLNTEVTSLATKADERIDNVAKTADSRIGSLETAVTQRYDTTEKDLFGTVNQSRTEILGAVADVRKDANTQLTTANSSLTSLSNAYSGVPAVLGTRLDKYTDCNHNELCWQGQLSDTLFAVRASSRQSTEAMVTLNKTIPQISNNFASITKNIDTITKPHWWDRALGYGLNGLLIYRALNPATNLVVTGAQLIGSQK